MEIVQKLYIIENRSQNTPVSKYLLCRCNFFIYCRKCFNNTCFPILFPLRYPWEWRNPFLYPFSGLILLGLNLSAVMTVACVICYYVANCYMFIAFIEDIKQEMNNLNEIHRSGGTLTQLKIKMAEIIRLDSNAKQLSFNSI